MVRSNIFHHLSAGIYPNIELILDILQGAVSHNLAHGGRLESDCQGWLRTRQKLEPHKTDSLPTETLYIKGGWPGYIFIACNAPDPPIAFEITTLAANRASDVHALDV
jgi:hypothetical protein